MAVWGFARYSATALFNARRNSATVLNRSWCFFASAISMNSWTDFGTSICGLCTLSGGGGSLRCIISTFIVVEARNGGLPASIS